MADSDTESELLAILEEMHAIPAWEGLPRELQLRWLAWIGSGWDTPRIRMYRAANRLLEGKPEPPSRGRLKALASEFVENWWP